LENDKVKRPLPAIITLVALSSLGVAWTDEANPQKTVKPIQITSLDQAKSLAPSTTSVSVHYTYQMHKADLFTGIMTTLARNPQIRHLTLRIPNSSHAKDETLEVLRDFQSLETLELVDARDWKAASVFEQVAGMKKLKQVKLSFL
jgi:hypothetical protein